MAAAPEVPGLTFGYNPPYNSGSFGSPDMGCTVDRIPAPCGLARRLISSGAAVPCRNNDCGARMVGGELKLPYYSEGDGFSYGSPRPAGTAPTLKRATAQERAWMRRTVRARGRDPFGVGYSETTSFTSFGISIGGISFLGITRPAPTDPCAGKKGLLNYRFPGPAINRVGAVGTHISDRHISLRMNRGASKYVFMDDDGGVNLFWDQSDSAMAQKGDIVAKTNQDTFMKGTATVQTSGRIAYVLAFPDWIGFAPDSPRIAAVGLDSRHNFDITNVNTVIVDPDCSTVITSHPGFPDAKFFPGGIFNWAGTPRWVPRTDPHNPGWTTAYR